MGSKEMTPLQAWDRYSDGITIEEFYGRVGPEGVCSLETALGDHLRHRAARPMDIDEVVGLMMHYIDIHETLREVSNEDLKREVLRRGYKFFRQEVRVEPPPEDAHGTG